MLSLEYPIPYWGFIGGHDEPSYGVYAVSYVVVKDCKVFILNDVGYALDGYGAIAVKGPQGWMKREEAEEFVKTNPEASSILKNKQLIDYFIDGAPELLILNEEWDYSEYSE